MRNEQIHSKFVTAKSVDQTNETECHSSSQLSKKEKRWLNRFIYAVIRLAQTPSYEAFQEELGAFKKKKKKKKKRRAKSESEYSLNEWKHQNISEAFIDYEQSPFCLWSVGFAARVRVHSSY